MKKFLILSAVLLLVLFLVACNVASGNGDNTTGDSAESTEEETTKEVLPPLSIVENGKTQYRVVLPDAGSNEVRTAANDLRKAIVETYGLSTTDVAIASDFEMRGQKPEDRYKYEILVGLTNRDESTEALNRIAYNDFIILVSGTRVAIIGGHDAATVRGVNYFIETYLKGESLMLDGGLADHNAAEYRKEITLLGQKLSAFKLVTTGSARYIAEQMALELGTLYGGILPIGGEYEDAVEYEIIIGSSRRGVTGTWGYDDYSISTDGKKIYIGGGSLYSIGSGARAFLNALKSSEGEIAEADISVNYVLPDRQEYINDISKLAMHWDIYMDTPEWMLDFDEKVAAMADPSGRLMSCLHRGDMVYYPEDSIEGIISAVRMGGDMVEIDLRRTKDGVIVLLHDATLTRTTNVEDFMGTPGFPDSTNLTDWTYAQLQCLSLKEGSGGKNAKVTNYKIPTFEEAMKVCAERIFVRLDKLDYWDYTNDIWPLIQKYEAYTTVIFTWHWTFISNNYQSVKYYKKLMVEQIGRSSVSFVGMSGFGDPAHPLDVIDMNGLDKCIRFTDCNFDNYTYEEYMERSAETRQKLKGKVRIYIDAHNGDMVYETAKNYKELKEGGINILLVNKGFQLCQYIAKTESPAQKS